MRLSKNTKRILKIATLSLLAMLEIYLIYAAAASMTTYHQHPKFVSADGQVAQSSGYRSQFFVCLVFAILVPLCAGASTYFFWFHKPKRVASEIRQETNVTTELAATTDKPCASDEVEPCPLEAPKTDQLNHGSKA